MAAAASAPQAIGHLQNINIEHKSNCRKKVDEILTTVQSAMVANKDKIRIPAFDASFDAATRTQILDTLRNKYSIKVSDTGDLTWKKDHPLVNTVGTVAQQSRALKDAFCDYELRAGFAAEYSFPCHACVLTSKSDYFSERVSLVHGYHDMKNVSPDSVKVLLDYLYGHLTALPENLNPKLLIEVWYLAIKCNLPHLNSLCKKFLNSPESFIKICNEGCPNPQEYNVAKPWQPVPIPEKLKAQLEKFGIKQIDVLAQNGNLNKYSESFLKVAKKLQFDDLILQLHHHSRDEGFKNKCKDALKNNR